MPRLMRDQQTLIARLEVASNMFMRAKGLLGRATLAPDQGMIFPGSNSIHTFFMRFAIDVVFVNRKMEVVKTVKRVGPGRMIWPVWRASSVIELSEGFLDRHPIQVGEKLHVDTALS